MALRESGLLKKIIRYRGSGQEIGVGYRDVCRGITRAFVRTGIGVPGSGLVGLAGECIPNNCPYPVAPVIHIAPGIARLPVVAPRLE